MSTLNTPKPKRIVLRTENGYVGTQSLIIVNSGLSIIEWKAKKQARVEDLIQEERYRESVEDEIQDIKKQKQLLRGPILRGPIL